MKSMKVVACLALVLLASGCSAPNPAPGRSGYEMGRDRYGTIPAPDPNRKISEQDCTQPLLQNGGNLLCQ